MTQAEHKFPCMICGKHVVLSKMKDTDAEFIFGLRVQKAAEFLNRPEGYSFESQLEWQKSRNGSEINYIIYDGSYRVGMVSIYDCDWTNRISNVGRLLLDGQYIHASKPYGLEALLMTYDYVFNVMGFRKIAGTINTKNEKVYSLQKYLGMKDEGTFIKHVLLNGEPHDLHFLSLFAEDFPAYAEKINKLLQKYR